MADVYRVIYTATGPEHQKAVNVSASSQANAIAAAKTNDKLFKDLITAGITSHNVVAGS